MSKITVKEDNSHQPYRYMKGTEVSAVIGIPPPGGVYRVKLFDGRYGGEQCVIAS